jgi:hypothetical protein
MSTMPFEFGDGVLVPFPFTSQRASQKKRPAVIASNRADGQSFFVRHSPLTRPPVLPPP